jgi:hypothetical protein
MPGPIAPFKVLVQGAGDNPNDALRGQQLRLVITQADSIGAVDFSHDKYEIDPRSWPTLPDSYRPMIAAAVARANCDPIAIELRDPNVQGASAEEVAAQLAAALEKIADAVPAAREIYEDVKRIVLGSTPKAYWWGLQLNLTADATTSLEKVVDGHLTRVLVALVPFVPKVALILPVIVPAGKILKALIEQARQGDASKGVRLELLFWVVPWVEAAT